MNEQYKKVIVADYVDPNLKEKVKKVEELLDNGQRVPEELADIEEEVLYFHSALNRVRI